MLVWCSLAAVCASRWNRRNCCGVEERLPGQHLYGHVPAERLLKGLVDDAHAAAADLAEDAEIAQPFQPHPAQRRADPAALLLVGLQPLHDGDGGEQLLDVRRQFRVLRRVLGDRRRLTAATAAP